MYKMLNIEREAIYHELGHFIAIISLFGKFVEIPLINDETKEQGIMSCPTIDYINYGFHFGEVQECTTSFKAYFFEISEVSKSCLIHAGEAAVQLVGLKKSLRLSGTDLEKARTIQPAERKKGRDLAISIMEQNLPLLEFLYSKIEKEFKREDLYFYHSTLYKWLEEFEQQIF